MTVCVIQEQWVREAVHKKAYGILKALEGEGEWPKVSEEDFIEFALEILHLMPAGEWLEAGR